MIFVPMRKNYSFYFLYSSQILISGITRSIPSIPSSGNISPQSITTILLLYSTTSIFSNLLHSTWWNKFQFCFSTSQNHTSFLLLALILLLILFLSIEKNIAITQYSNALITVSRTLAYDSKQKNHIFFSTSSSSCSSKSSSTSTTLEHLMHIK